MQSDKELKKELKAKFFREYSKYYPVDSLKQLGLKRYVCKKCGRGFWSLKPRDFCGEPACSGESYSFVGKKISDVSYFDVYKMFVKTFAKWGYKPIRRYPVVARWYDQLYFVVAGVNVFQPYVVSGEVDPPADAVLEDQFCLRFNDMENVGINPSQYTGFIMIGQHVFNREKHIYFKDEGVKQMWEFFVNVLNIPREELILHEDVWVGGGNFGPSIEFFYKSLELANQVYMQYEQLEDGYKELKTKVIDMGAGAERWAWVVNGSITSYDVVFPKVLEYIFAKTGVKRDDNFWREFIKLSGLLNVDDVGSLDKAWSMIAERMGINVEEIKSKVIPVAEAYILAEHTRTLLVAINDGALPSNVGGGYNLRVLLRRCFSILERNKWDIDLVELMKLHLEEFGKWYSDLKLGHIPEIIDIEKRRYYATLKKAKSLLKKYDKIDVDTMLMLYTSHGITPDIVAMVKSIDIPHEFYERLNALKKARKKEVSKVLSGEYPKTELLFYEQESDFEFDANVIGIEGKYVILDKTLFYPRSGGQDCDKGFINNIPVVDVFKQNGVVVHVLMNDPNFTVGDEVHCVIDQGRRKKLTVLHTAVHVLNYAARKVLGDHVNQEGAEKTVEKARLDVTHYELPSFDQVQEIERVANELVRKAVKVEKFFMPRTEAELKYSTRIYQGGAVPGKVLRIVKIGDYDVEACGGTHLDNTKDIKLIKIINVSRIQDGVVRFEIVAGDDALKKVQEYEKILRQVSELWGVEYKDIPKTAERFFKEWKQFKKRIQDLEVKYLELVLKGKGEDKFETVEVDADVNTVISVASRLNPKQGVFIKGNGFGVVVSNTVNALEEIKKYYSRVSGDSRFAKGFK